MSFDCTDSRLDLFNMVRRDADGGVLARFSGREIYCSAVARSAIRKACDVLGLGQGSEILVPAYNCGSEIAPLIAAGTSVVLYRVDRSSNVDVEDLKRRITPKTRAIYITHYFGFTQPRMAEIKAICDAQNLFLIEDCALALLGGSGDGQPGSFGDVAIFCFYKFFPVAGGGALIINNPELDIGRGFFRPAPLGFVAKQVVRALGHQILPRRIAGVVKSGLKRLGKSGPTEPAPTAGELPDMPGEYYFRDEFQDAGISTFARTPLRSFSVDQCIAQRRRNFQHYLEFFADTADATALFPELPEGVCPLSFPVLVPDRDHFCTALNQAGIAATPWWAGYHRDLSWGEHHDARFLKESVLSLPSHQGLGEGHIRHISDTVKTILAKRRVEQDN